MKRPIIATILLALFLAGSARAEIQQMDITIFGMD
jgi:hypothetical protein